MVTLREIDLGMDKHRKLRRYSRKDYSLLVDFPVEIVGRDGVVRRYTFEESIRLYQRRITSSNARYPDRELAEAEITHCRRRIEQLRRSYFARYGWASLRSSGALGLEEGLAGEVAAFLRRCLEGTEHDPEALRLSSLGDGEDPLVLYVQRSAGPEQQAPPPNLLYVYRFPEEEAGPARDAFFGFLRILRGVRGQAEGVEVLIAFHHSADCGLVLTGQVGDALLNDPRRAGFLEMPVLDSAPIDEEPSPDAAREALRALRAGRLREALEGFLLAYEINPWRRVACLGASAVADALGQFRDAETMAMMGTRYFQGDPAVWYQLGLARLRLGELDAAEEALTELAPLDGDRYATALLGAFVAIRAGRTLPGLRRLWSLRRLEAPAGEADLRSAALWLTRVTLLWVLLRTVVGTAVVGLGALTRHQPWVALVVTFLGLLVWAALDIVAFRTIGRTISKPDRVRLNRLDALARAGEALPVASQ